MNFAHKIESNNLTSRADAWIETLRQRHLQQKGVVVLQPEYTQAQLNRMKRKKEELELLLPPKRKHINLRDYQQQCIETLDARPAGSRDLVVMATGLGKTATFTQLPAHDGKTLIVSSGNEIVINPLEYYDRRVPIGLEMGTNFRSKIDFPNAQVISASVQSLHRRLNDFAKDEFYNIIIDEAHHATAPTYKKIIDYFTPQHLIGFTATPFRADGVDLATVFDDIVFNRDIKWGIKSGYLCDVFYQKVKVDIDLRNIRAKKTDESSIADFTSGDLAKAMAKSPPIIADVYKRYAFGPTLIFVAGVKIAYETAAIIPGAVAVTGEMSARERATILAQFRAGKIKCIVNCGVFKEGVDAPNIMSIILARPTLSNVLYAQMAGRGLRVFEGKQYLNLIEMEGIMAEGMQLCNAPALFGVNMEAIPKEKRDGCSGRMLTQMEDWAANAVSSAENWLMQSNSTQAWADNNGYDLHRVNWLAMPDGRMELTFPKEHVQNRQPGQIVEQYRMTIPAPDALNRVIIGQSRMPFQLALDLAKETLDKQYTDQAVLWDKNKMRWGQNPASEAQKRVILRTMPDFDFTDVSSYQASTIISKLFSKNRRLDEEGIIHIFPVPPDQEPADGVFVENIIINNQVVPLYDYRTVNRCAIDIKREDLERRFCHWVSEQVWLTYAVTCQNDINALIALMNKKNRISMARVFVSSICPEYKYICRLNGKPVSRGELFEMLARLADELVPAVIQTRIIKGNDDMKTIRRCHPDVANPPLDALKYQFPTTRQRLIADKSSPKRLSKTAAEIKQQDMERWAKQQKEKEDKKAKAKTPAKRGRPPKK